MSKVKNISEDGKFNIDKQIKTLFGEYEDMIMTSVILQTGVNFIDLDYAEQKKILTNILGLNLFENVRLISSQKHRHYTTNILKTSTSLNFLLLTSIFLELRAENRRQGEDCNA